MSDTEARQHAKEARQHARDAAAHKAESAISLLPAAWTVVALVVQLVFVSVLMPRLPESTAINFGLLNEPVFGPIQLGFATADLAIIAWVMLGVFAALSVLAFRIRHVGSWSIVITGVIPALTALFLVNVLGQLQPTDWATELARGITVVSIPAFVGFALGMVSDYVVYRRIYRTR